jgi:acetolactate synthase I/II/III large subunit
MTGAQYIVDFLVKRGVTDAFGIPGGAVLDLVYAMDGNDRFSPHLSYHEQCAGFAANGYAQECGKLGVAYATRGPGFTNLVTAIADAYCDSLPVLYVVGHASSSLYENMRIMVDQEFDTCSMVKKITKYAKRVDSAEDLAGSLEKAYRIAMDGRKGPVFLDVASKVLSREIGCGCFADWNSDKRSFQSCSKEILEAIKTARRPVVLLGDGINQVQKEKEFLSFIDRVRIPCLSSRYAHNIGNKTKLYYGYIGSHGIRAANFILSKADLIIALGNRLHYPVSSESYSQVMNRVKVLRFDIDEGEFERRIPGSSTYHVDLVNLLDFLAASEIAVGDHEEWIYACNTLREELILEDVNGVVESIKTILTAVPADYVIASDVGNNEFWLSRACILAGVKNRVLYSKSLGVLGCGVGKAIGAFYATHKPVLCFTGDQGLQMNIQELMFIAQHGLPIAIVLLNNHASGMIKDRETASGKNKLLHTTKDSGYGTPDFEAIAGAYGISYTRKIEDLENVDKPVLVEIPVDEQERLIPSLPKGEPFQNLFPELPRKKYEFLENL